MTVDHKLGQALVFSRVDGVADDTENVETRQNGLGELNILTERHGAVVAATDRVGSGHDGTASLQCCDNTSLRDGDGLLLHCFVNRCTVLVVHLVELIDQASTPVSKHKSTTLQSPFGSKRISPDTSSETDGRSTLTSGKYSTVSSVFDILEHL